MLPAGALIRVTWLQRGGHKASCVQRCGTDPFAGLLAGVSVDMHDRTHFPRSHVVGASKIALDRWRIRSENFGTVSSGSSAKLIDAICSPRGMYLRPID